MATAKKTTTKKTVAKTPAKPTTSDTVTVAYEGYAPTEVGEAPMEQKPMESNWEIKDRVYYLVTRKKPILMTIPAKHTAKRELLWFDPEMGYQRELRYATNQPSPFVDQQTGHVTLAHIIFRDGTLFVPKAKQNLQKLLSLYHPLKDVLYSELDEKKQAIDDLDTFEYELEALNAAHDMDIDQAEAILRVEMGSKAADLTSKEIRRDLMLFAKKDPVQFISLANDENVEIRSTAVKAVEKGILRLASDQRTFTWGNTNRKIMTVPFDENPYSALAAFFKTDEGIEVFQTIEKRLK